MQSIVMGFSFAFESGGNRHLLPIRGLDGFSIDSRRELQIFIWGVAHL